MNNPKSQIIPIIPSHMEITLLLEGVNLPAWFEICLIQKNFPWYCLFGLSGGTCIRKPNSKFWENQLASASPVPMPPLHNTMHKWTVKLFNTLNIRYRRHMRLVFQEHKLEGTEHRTQCLANLESTLFTFGHKVAHYQSRSRYEHKLEGTDHGT